MTGSADIYAHWVIKEATGNDRFLMGNEKEDGD